MNNNNFPFHLKICHSLKEHLDQEKEIFVEEISAFFPELRNENNWDDNIRAKWAERKNLATDIFNSMNNN